MQRAIGWCEMAGVSVELAPELFWRWQMCRIENADLLRETLIKAYTQMRRHGQVVGSGTPRYRL